MELSAPSSPVQRWHRALSLAVQDEGVGFLGELSHAEERTRSLHEVRESDVEVETERTQEA